MSENTNEISRIRIEKAEELIKSARLLLDSGDLKSSANRSYYAVFNAMRSCLALLLIDNKKHSGVISEFRLHFIKSGNLSVELSDIITELFDVRTQSDYNDFFEIEYAEAERQLVNAERFVNEVKLFLTDYRPLFP